MVAAPKPKKISRKNLIKRLDDIVSKIVRLRDKKCVTCGSTQQLGCGHVFSRSHYATRWDLENCHAQCWKCNYNARWHDTVFYPEWYRDKVGDEKFKELYYKWKTTSHFKIYELKGMLEGYKFIYEELEKEEGET